LVKFVVFFFFISKKYTSELNRSLNGSHSDGVPSNLGKSIRGRRDKSKARWPKLRSMVEIYRSLSSILFMFGRWYTSFFNKLFTFLKYRQKRYLPLGFLIIIIEFDHLLNEGSIMPAPNILSTSSLIASCTLGDTR